MNSYNCEICNYITKRQYNYNKHLNTKKHLINVKNYVEGTTKIISNYHKIPQNTTFAPHNNTKIEPHKNKNFFNCKYCNKDYSRIDSLNRHIEKSCKEKKEFDKIENKNNELHQIIKSQTKKINKLLEKSVKQINNTQNNNSNNTINNTIHINNYGEENLEMLTDEFKERCITRPFYAVIDIIRKIHFNDDYPENKNMRLVNKRDNKIQVLTDGKWKYRYKDEAVKYAFDDSNERLEQFYLEKSHKFRKFIKLCCEDIIKNIHECESELMKELYKEMDLILLNGC